jgi:L,D-peptidoglycan transpeptidase YkuD (ErfK/YbiS/YcfS/YnhG family)
VRPRKTTSYLTLRRVAVTTLAVLLLGFSFDAAAAVASPATVRAAAVPAAAAAAAAQATIGPRAAMPAAATTSPLAVTPAGTQDQPFWITLWNLLQQFWAWLFPPAQQQLPLPYSGPANQVVTVDAANPSSTTATVRAWNRSGSGWEPATGPIPAMVGSQGIGQASEWAARTPAGAYSLTQAFGRQPNPGTRLPYFQSGWWDWWNENSGSPGYNTHMVQPSSPGGASENLYGAGPVYDYAVNIDYNTAGIAGAGSAFFLHVTNGRPTAGCVAIPASDLTTIMRWLDPNQHPVIVIGAH